jgi:hypothetical protein
MPVVFCQTSGGAAVVLEWLRTLPADDRRAIGTGVVTVQVASLLGLPLCPSTPA